MFSNQMIRLRRNRPFLLVYYFKLNWVSHQFRQNGNDISSTSHRSKFKDQSKRRIEVPAALRQMSMEYLCKSTEHRRTFADLFFVNSSKLRRIFDDDSSRCLQSLFFRQRRNIGVCFYMICLKKMKHADAASSHSENHFGAKLICAADSCLSFFRTGLYDEETWKRSRLVSDFTMFWWFANFQPCRLQCLKSTDAALNSLYYRRFKSDVWFNLPECRKW